MAAILKTRYSFPRAARLVNTAQALHSRYSEPVAAYMPVVVTGVWQVYRAYEGVQIVINWPNFTGGVRGLTLMRKVGDWPGSVTDGRVLYQQDVPFSVFGYSDREVNAYTIYYYALFLQDQNGLWHGDRKYRGKTFPLPTGYFADKMLDLLPQLYRQMDGEA
jgi:hypothetical protein